jgi:hypothetical protein
MPSTDAVRCRPRACDAIKERASASAVRTDKHQNLPLNTAVNPGKQLRSGLTNRTTHASLDLRRLAAR